MSDTRYATASPLVSRRGGNSATCVFGGDPLGAAFSQTTPRELFEEHHHRFADLLGQRPEVGVLVAAVCPLRGVVGSLWLKATTELRAGTIGRHTACDLVLPDDPDFPLRHSMVLVRCVLGVVRVRLLDLNSSTGFFVRRTGPLRAADSDGPFAAQASTFTFFVFQTGARALPWRPDSPDPFSTLPDVRVNVTPRPPPSYVAPRLPGAGTTTSVCFAGPREVGPGVLIAADEDVQGTLSLITNGVEQRLSVGAAALEHGVMLGRYPRCTGGIGTGLQLSRVHALVIKMDGVLHLVDAGSSNGTWLGGLRIRCAPLPAETSAWLAGLGGLVVRWWPKLRC